MRPLFDTHAHYTDGRFIDEFPGGPDALLREIFEGGVEKIINVSTSTAGSADVLSMSERYPGMYAAVGVHPSDAASEESLSAALLKLREMICADMKREGGRKIVAIGETGLDYHFQPVDRELQRSFFEAQLLLAEETGLPVIIHDREAHGDCFEAVLRHPRVRGVFHSFSGSPEMALELARRGIYISFSGTVSFKNAPRVRAAAAAVPEELILIETDAPYLAPVPYRGKLNRSDYAFHTAAAVAGARGTDTGRILDATYRNACRLFLDRSE